MLELVGAICIVVGIGYAIQALLVVLTEPTSDPLSDLPESPGDENDLEDWDDRDWGEWEREGRDDPYGYG